MAVIGSDGFTPTYDPSGLWTIWNINQIYTGTIGQNMYVPKLDDYVIEPTSGTLYIVSALNLNTYLSTFTQIDIAKLPLVLRNQNLLTNPSVSDSVANYVAYYDSSVSPATINVDSSLIIYNTQATQGQLFLGTDIINNPTPISLTLDTNGNPSGTMIPLTAISYDNGTTLYNKIIPTIYTEQVLNNGDIVTLLLYNLTGQVISKQVLVIEETTNYPIQNSSYLLVDGLSLESPFISTSQPNTINLPSNVGISNLNLTGVVSYNNGTSTKHSVNTGNAFNVFGLDQVLKANILGTIPLVIQYVLSPTEMAIVGSSYNNKVVSQNYTLNLISPNYDYQLQLYVVPFYTGNMFTFKFFLLSMSRNIFYDVTTLVTFSNGTGFNGTEYGTLQSLEVSLNTSLINNTLNGLTITQSMEVMLSDPSTGPSTIYQIWTNPSVSNTPYGNNVRAKSLNSANSTLDITCTLFTLADWLQLLYYDNVPVTNNQLESEAPTPTHFDIIYNTSPIASNQLYENSQSTLFAIEQWNQNIDVTPNTIPMNSTILVRFLAVNGDTKSVLSVSPMLITQY